MAVRERTLARRARPRAAYTRILLPVATPGEHAALAVAVACRLAAERHAVVTALAAIEVPAELPLDADMPEAEDEAAHALAQARAVAELFGVTISRRIVRARAAGEAIVDQAIVGGAEIVVVGARRRERASRNAPALGGTVGFVLRNAPCRVVVATAGGGR